MFSIGSLQPDGPPFAFSFLFLCLNSPFLKVMENYKRPTTDSAATRNRDEDDDDADGDLLLPRVENRHPRYSIDWI